MGQEQAPAQRVGQRSCPFRTPRVLQGPRGAPLLRSLAAQHLRVKKCPVAPSEAGLWGTARAGTLQALPNGHLGPDCLPLWDPEEPSGS
jgi:hypothetical protein